MVAPLDDASPGYGDQGSTTENTSLLSDPTEDSQNDLRESRPVSFAQLSLDRRQFFQLLAAAGAAVQLAPIAQAQAASAGQLPARPYHPARVPNEYALLLPGEREALARPPQVRNFGDRGMEAAPGAGESGADAAFRPVAVGEDVDGWRLVHSGDMNGVATAVWEKRVTHQGAFAYVTELGGAIAIVPKQVGQLASIRPRLVAEPQRFRRDQVPGPDIPGRYILESEEDPCYENVAALGPEYIGWSLVANEEAGPLGCVYLDETGRSREPTANPQAQWAPDLEGYLFDPADWFPFDDPGRFAYEPGWSKRTLLGGYLPAACTGVWNQAHRSGYEAIVILPPGKDAKPMARMRLESAAVQQTGTGVQVEEHFWHCARGQFYEEMLGLWDRWSNFYRNTMPVEIPDPWLLDAARAGITLCRCSYRGLDPTYQIGEGGYTKIPERSHALFPVAHYEFLWAHQIWGLTASSDQYFQRYLDLYILPDGNFLYNTQDQVEGPLNVGLFLWNSARSFAYTGDAAAFRRRLPALERMLGYVLARYEFGKEAYPRPDRRYGLIWGSPEADLGDTNNDTPNSHPFYYQNAVCVWRGLHEHAHALTVLGTRIADPQVLSRGESYARLAEEMRGNIEASLRATIAAGNPAMRASGITPFEPNDTRRKPAELSSYENHRFMMDWFLADWGDPALDLGHLRHRELAGQQICGLHTDGPVPRTSNFMEHGTLVVRIRQDDYRPFLLTLYGLVCYAADSGNRYSPEDAYLPGSYPGEGNRYGWSSVVNSALQPTLGLRWLLCYEESDRAVCHLQKAAPRHWFAAGEHIRVEHCPTRWGAISWTTEAADGRSWNITVDAEAGFSTATVAVHIHPPDGLPLRSSTAGRIEHDRVILSPALFAGGARVQFTVA